MVKYFLAKYVKYKWLLKKIYHNNKLSLFCYDLNNAFLSANIPINKLENPILKKSLKKIRVSLDETTDSELISIGKTFLLNCKVLEKMNLSTVAKMLNNAFYIVQKALNMITYK
ncbi:CGG triplet repeat-binding protein 1, partial [Aphis craccivora]